MKGDALLFTASMKKLVVKRGIGRMVVMMMVVMIVVTVVVMMMLVMVVSHIQHEDGGDDDDYKESKYGNDGRESWL